MNEDIIKEVAPEEWAELQEWADKFSDRSEKADPGQREDCIIGLQEYIIAKLAAAVAALRCCGNCGGSGYHGGAFGCFRAVDYLFVGTVPSDECCLGHCRWTPRAQKEA